MVTPFDAPDWRGMNQQDLDSGLNNGAAVAGSGDMVAGWERRSAEFRAARPDHVDLRYGHRERNRIDFFKARPNAPTLLFIHGGYWQARAKEVFTVFAEGPMVHGINVALIGYTLAPDATLDEIVAEIHAGIDYLAGQFAAGVDAVQIFDTWAGTLPPAEFARWCIAPAQKIISGLRARVPDAKVIGFPRGAGTNLGQYVADVPANAVSIDWTIDLAYVRSTIQPRMAVQGNLDPVLLFASWKELKSRAEEILRRVGGRPGHIFNLGHGILPETPVENVKALAAFVQDRTGGKA